MSALEAFRVEAVTALRSVSTRDEVQIARWHLDGKRDELADARKELADAKRDPSFKRGKPMAAARVATRQERVDRSKEMFTAAREEYNRLSAAGERSRLTIEATLHTLSSVQTQEWQQVCRDAVEEGVYALTLQSLTPTRGETVPDEADLYLALAISVHAGVPSPVARELMKRVQHVGSERLLEGVALDDVIAAKQDFERAGAKVKIAEGARPGSHSRTPIPEKVRREVWRRDNGRCVDCGSRERLEFDHIVPVSKGGSDTARNIELRCESCNRSKGARI
ncbi:MAG: HNH endonuclease [Gaiella sp.]